MARRGQFGKKKRQYRPVSPEKNGMSDSGRWAERHMTNGAEQKLWAARALQANIVR